MSLVTYISSYIVEGVKARLSARKGERGDPRGVDANVMRVLFLSEFSTARS